MKILFLNPRIDAEHKISRGLEEKGISLLFPEDTSEVWQMLQLHGTTIDLAILHLEELGVGPEATLKLLERIKGDPYQADLPIVLTTDRWTDEECAQHQEGRFGVNAYLKWPFSEEALYGLIEPVLGGGEAPPPSLQDTPSISLQDQSSPSLQALLGSENPLAQSLPPLSQDLSINELSVKDLPVQQDISVQQDLSQPEGSVTVPSQSPSLRFELDASSSTLQEGSQLGSTNSSPEYPEHPEQDHELAQEMPYLFSGSQKNQDLLSQSGNVSAFFSEPVGDAVVPGGAAQSPDIETFKKYLLLREQDVAVLSNQLKAVHGQVAMLEQQLREEKGKNVELTHVVSEQKRKIGDFDKDKNLQKESFESDIQELRFQLKTKVDKARLLESQVRDVTEEMEHLKERVRTDIRKIRVREKELENRLEIMKKDSEALIGARENKIVELKRKVDLMEFNMDLLQDQYTREKENNEKLKERLAKAAQVVRVAGGLLDSNKENNAQSNRSSGTESGSISGSESVNTETVTSENKLSEQTN